MLKLDREFVIYLQYSTKVRSPLGPHQRPIDKLPITSALPNYTSRRPEFDGRSHLPALFVFGDKLYCI
ncbi:hypothetical protein IQ270_07535 [Microcoleus sp. LEGE 07076]|uniref:hypothetical protein n=1 Tax=Microcoleus sp. LEGE 07076 TaxID=915322 RepID=UPI001881602C|nr:hypothetical protein [Microcoleus sp. LEGE 07076]MBE9184574.1 hypothetical protein [Microcoleus sp. LEGE 07076]